VPFFTEALIKLIERAPARRAAQQSSDVSA